MRNPFKKKALSASPEVIEALHEGRTNFMVRLGGTNKQIAIQVAAAMEWGMAHFYKNSPAVRTVIDLIANNAAQLDLRLYEEVAPDERKEQADHAAMESLRHPNAAMSSDQFIRYMFKAFLLYGNAFASKHRRPGQSRTQFVVLPPERIEVNGPGVTPTFYRIWNLDGTQSEPILAEDMVHWRNENFIDMRVGVSPLESLRSVIAEESALQLALIELAKSGLAEPSWISRPLDAPEISGEGIARLEEHTANRLKNAAKVPPLLDEGMELKGFGFSPKDSEALAVRKYALQQVASLYGVPLGMVGLDDNLEEAQAQFYADTIPTICEAFCRQLNLQLLQAEYNEDDYYFEFDIDEKQMGNERLKALTSAAGVPPLLRDEARAMLNKAPVPGGSEPMTPSSMVPGSDPSKLLPSKPGAPGSKPSYDVMPIQNPAGADQGGGAREGDPGVKPNQSSTDALLKFYSRFASAKKDNPERWGRELAEDLIKAGLNGDAHLMAARAVERLLNDLGSGDRTEVLNQAKADAPRLAARWEMRPEAMKMLGIPAEAIWERLGYSQDEINEMRALRLAESLAGEG
jgi:HK97 family phage portal protein